jgi:hypothetical protein
VRRLVTVRSADRRRLGVHAVRNCKDSSDQRRDPFFIWNGVDDDAATSQIGHDLTDLFRERLVRVSRVSFLGLSSELLSQVVRVLGAEGQQVTEVTLGAKLSTKAVGNGRRCLLEPRHLTQVSLNDHVDLRLGELQVRGGCRPNHPWPSYFSEGPRRGPRAARSRLLGAGGRV